MVGALGKALARAGHQVGLVTPLYSGHSRAISGDQKNSTGPGSAAWRRAGVRRKFGPLRPEHGLTLYFIHQPEFYQRAGALSGSTAWIIRTTPQRFIFFSKCVAHLARHLPWKPEIVHLHDWQTGLVPLLILHEKLTEGWGNTPRTCLHDSQSGLSGDFPRLCLPAYESALRIISIRTAWSSTAS